jgi:hypothetical protein
MPDCLFHLLSPPSPEFKPLNTIDVATRCFWTHYGMGAALGTVVDIGLTQRP